jgi:hypothetical protein
MEYRSGVVNCKPLRYASGMFRSILTATIAVSVLSSLASAQSSPAPAAPRTDEALHIEAGADAWFARLLGDVNSPAGVKRDIRLLDLRDSEVAFAGHARVMWDRCFAHVAGFSFDTDGSYSSGGDSFQTEFQWWEVEADFGYAVFTPFADQASPWGDASFDRYGDNVNEDGTYRLDLRISPTIGVSYHDIELNDVNLTQATASSTDGGWMAARLGGQIELRLRPGADFSFVKDVIIEAGFNAGPLLGVSGDADGSGIAYELDAGAKLMFHENVGVHVGYRLRGGDFDSTGTASDLDIGLQGLFAGVSVRF